MRFRGLRSGHQEARGAGTAMGDRYFEGVFEELDSEHEYHHDVHSTPQRLYWVPPVTASLEVDQSKQNEVGEVVGVAVGALEGA